MNGAMTEVEAARMAEKAMAYKYCKRCTGYGKCCLDVRRCRKTATEYRKLFEELKVESFNPYDYGK